MPPSHLCIPHRLNAVHGGLPLLLWAFQLLHYHLLHQKLERKHQKTALVSFIKGFGFVLIILLRIWTDEKAPKHMLKKGKKKKIASSSGTQPYTILRKISDSFHIKCSGWCSAPWKLSTLRTRKYISKTILK